MSDPKDIATNFAQGLQSLRRGPGVAPTQQKGSTELPKPEEFPEAPPPKCVECKDSGWIETHTPGEPERHVRLKRCPCVAENWYRERLEKLERENARFAGLTLQTYEPENDEQGAAREACKQWVEAWPEVERGILLMGQVGVGKTGLLWVTAKAAGAKTYEPPRILRALDLAEAPVFKDRDDSTPTRSEIIRSAMRSRLLIFDDLGTGKRSESADGAYFRLLDKRHIACLPTLVTTNYTEERVPIMGGGFIETFRDRVGGRLYSRLQQLCDFYTITGADRRQKESDGRS